MALKDLRIQAGMSQAEFADYFEIPKKTVENWEQGINKCPSYVEKLIAEKMEKVIEERNGYHMDRKKFKELRVIDLKENLPANAMYYSREYKRLGNSHLDWENIYNEKFELIEQVIVRYSNVLADLQRIVQEKDKDDIALMAYDFADLGNGFFSLVSKEDTLKAMELAVESLSN